MNSATCLLRSAKGTPPSLPISILFLQNYGSRRSVVVGRASKPVVCRRWQQTAAAAVTRAKEQDRINGPETTRPAPLVIPTTAPNANIFWKLINRGRGCELVATSLVPDVDLRSKPTPRPKMLTDCF